MTLPPACGTTPASLARGAHIRYHGDFDAAGLAICAPMQAIGCTPWRMGSADHLAAAAEPAPGTPWDPALQRVFDDHRRIIHEERLLPGLLAT